MSSDRLRSVRTLLGDCSNLVGYRGAVVQNVGIVVYMIYRMICTVAAILGSIACPMVQRLTCIAAAMLGGATTSDVGRAGGTALDGSAGLQLASLDHELDDFVIDGGPENCLQLLLRRPTQEALVALVGEEYLECYGTRSRN